MLTIEVNQEVNILSFSFLGLLFPMGSECWYLPETKVNIFPARTPLPDHSEGFSFHFQASSLPTQGIMLCRRGPPPFFPSAIGRSFGVHLNSGERIPSRLSRDGVSEQRNKEVLDGIGFPAALRRGISFSQEWRGIKSD